MLDSVNINNDYLTSNTGMEKTEIQNMAAKSKDAVADSFENNTAGKVVSGNSQDPEVMKKTILVLPFVYLADKLADKAIGGKDGKSLLTGIANIGDKISNTFHLDKVFSEEKTAKVSDFLKNNRFFKYFGDDYKAVAKSSFAKSSGGMKEKYSSELFETVKKLQENPEAAKYFDKTAGFFKPETLSGLKDGTAKLSKELIDDLSSGADKIIKDGGNFSGLTALNSKYKAASSQTGKTLLGKTLAKGTLKTKDLLTYGGGLLSLAFAANALVQSYQAAKEAPEGEKKSTFMHVLSENYIGIALFQPCINLCYKLGGNKYRGMTTEGRAALKDLVAKTNADKTLTKEGLKVAKLQSNLLIKGVDKDKVASLAGKTLSEAKTMAKSLKKEGAKLKWWEKPLKFAGKLLDTGLDKMKTGKHPTLSGFAGGFARFAIIMFVLQPLIQKPVTKLVHKIFGEPKTYLEKQKAEENKTDASEQNTPENGSSDTNLINKYTSSAQNTQTEDITGLSQTQNNAAKSENEQSNADLNRNSKSYNMQQDNALPASGLSGGSTKQTERYIPSVQVERNDSQNEAETEQYVEEILKRSDSLIESTKKLLK